MATVAEVLKSAGIADDVAAGLPKEVVAALGGFVAEADTKLSTAAQKATEAEEARRQSELNKKDIQDRVDEYIESLNKVGSLEAQLAANAAYFKKLKDQGFDVPEGSVTEPGDGRKPVVPGSPAIGGNAVDEGKIISRVRGEVGSVFSQYIDANNEHMRLYGYPIPESSSDIAEEAARARKPVGAFVAEKYNFKQKHAEKAKADYDARVAADVKAGVEEERRKDAEKNGSNPNLRSGESSRSSFVPKIKGEEFHKSDGNLPRRERERRMLDNLHKEVAEIQGAA